MRTRTISRDKGVRSFRGDGAPGRPGSYGIRVIDVAGNDIFPVFTLRVPWVLGLDDDEALTGSEVGRAFTNNSGAALSVGDVVVLQNDGTITTTTVAQDTRPVGVVTVAAADGEEAAAVFAGYVGLVRVGATVASGEYAETSTSAGLATSNPARREGSFGVYLASGTEPSAYLFGMPDAVDEAADPAETFLTRATGERHVPSTVTAGAAQTLDLETANTFDVTLTAACTITLSNPPSSGIEGRWTIALRQGGTGSYAVTWPASVKWRDTDGTQTVTAPTLSSAVGAVDTVDLRTLDGGATYGASLENGSGGSASALDNLSDVTITTPAADQQLQYVGGVWVNNARRWEPVTTNPGTGPELVWDGDDIVMTWRAY